MNNKMDIATEVDEAHESVAGFISTYAIPLLTMLAVVLMLIIGTLNVISYNNDPMIMAPSQNNEQVAPLL